MPSHPIYRKAALSHRHAVLSSQKLIRLTPPHLWLTLVTIWVILISLVLWSFLGNIPTRAIGAGILVGEGGGIFNATAPAGANDVVKIPVSVGQYVHKGETVAYLKSPELIKKIAIERTYLQELQKKYDDLNATAEDKIKLVRDHLLQEQESLQNSLKSQSENLKKIEELLNIKVNAYKKGLLTRQDVAASEQNFYATKVSLDEIKQKLVELKQQEERITNEWQDRLRTGKPAD